MEPTNPVVIFRLGSLGDTVVALPCFHKLAQCFPENKRFVLTNAPVAATAAPLEAVLSGGGLIHGSIAYPANTRSPHVLWSLRRQLKALHADTLVYLPPVRPLAAVLRDLAFFTTCGFRKIIGASLSADRRLNRVAPQTGLVEPECERLARTLSSLGPIDLRDPAMWDLHLTDDERRSGLAFLQTFGGRPFIAINMGGKSVLQDWGEENWRSLLTVLAPHMTAFGLLTIGSAVDRERAQRVAPLWQGPVVNACGDLSPRESGAVLCSARLFIGHDSGPLHLAAAVGASCIGLFGANPASPPQKWHPYIGTHTVIHRPEGMSAIQISEVADAITRHLETEIEQKNERFGKDARCDLDLRTVSPIPLGEGTGTGRTSDANL